MIPTKPNVALFVLPEGSREIAIAKDQPKYQTLHSIVTPDGRVCSQWTPDADELARLNAGHPVTLIVHTFGQRLQPVALCVGEPGVDLT